MLAVLVATSIPHDVPFDAVRGSACDGRSSEYSAALSVSFRIRVHVPFLPSRLNGRVEIGPRFK
jgi:hypothetical protein